MEKFMFLFRESKGDNHAQNANDSKEGEAYVQSWMTWMQGLGHKGILAERDPLQRTGKKVNGKSKVA